MYKRTLLTIALAAGLVLQAFAQPTRIERNHDASPFCFWYWMYGAVTKPAIKADLETMKSVGLRGTYLMPIRGVDERPEFGGKAQQLTPEFWDMVGYSMHLCDSLGLELGVHICDGFALAGGPWFTPEESMQKVVWTDTIVALPKKAGERKRIKIVKPSLTGIERIISAYAMPVNYTSTTIVPTGFSASENVTHDEKNEARANEPCWFEYDFGHDVDIRNIEILPSGTNIQCQRLSLEIKAEGSSEYVKVKDLTPSRQGWQNTACGSTFSLPANAKGRYYRFSWTPAGTEPGSEDLDAAKWKPTLRLKKMIFHVDPRVHQWEGKAAYAWRVAEASTDTDLPKQLCTPLNTIAQLTVADDGTIDISSLVRQYGNDVKGVRIFVMGHSSTGQTNATAGGGKGLECDKFSKTAVNKLVDNWFAKFSELAKANNGNNASADTSLKYFHVDSWECGCQNWSQNFADEFMKRRGYDLLPWLPVMAGVPVESAEESERVLRDVRLTVNDLVNDVFFATVRERAHAMNMKFSSESIAPTFVSDGLDHYQFSDLPMGEYWLNSPTHDKPNDMFDAISGAHIYGKNIVQAEGFTEVRGVWDEDPASVKSLLDRNFALGMNRLFFHVNTHNPWMDRKPGMTLDGIGFFFQRDQIWMPEARPFVDYVTRCSALLQQGRPVQDIAVYIGDEMPRRSVLPERLVPMLPGIFGEERVASEQARLANVGQPMQESPVGVNHSAGIVDTKDWVNALRGYQYDSFNPDVLLNHSTARNGKMVLDGGAEYRVVVVPQARPMNPECVVSSEAKAKIEELQKAGVVVIDKPYTDADFSKYGLQRDVVLPKDVAYAHRTSKDGEIYFLSNQKEETISIGAEFPRWEGRDNSNAVPYIYDAVSNSISVAYCEDKTVFVDLPANGSCFVLFPNSDISALTSCLPEQPRPCNVPGDVLHLNGPYTLTLKEANYTTTLDNLVSWTDLPDGDIKYFSGHGLYTTNLKLKKKPVGNERLDLGTVYNIAHVWVNGIDCGIIWTAPYEAQIGHALKKGNNKIEIEVVNTWANALRGMDEGKAPYDGIWTNAKYRMKQPHLLPAGLLPAQK